jgi:hypothetical protein
MWIGRLMAVGLVVAVLAGGRGVAAEPQRASAPADRASRPPLLLDVPFVPQTAALCGGAAVAMVLRYWGAEAVYAEDFSSLVDESAEGIRIGILARAVHELGWRALPYAGAAADTQEHLGRGRPVIALIEDRPGRHHYVVIVAWAAGGIVYHDPARGSFRVARPDTFDRAWSVTGRTALLIVPDTETADAFEAGAPPTRRGCDEPLARAVSLAQSGETDAAEALLVTIDAACPTFSGGPRELAGLRFVQNRWSEAAGLAARAVERDPSDLHAWQLLASARFIEGDTRSALAAWNRRMEPRVDLVQVDGLDRTRHDLVAGIAALPPDSLITDATLRRAARRVASVPAVQLSRVGFTPRANGRALVNIAVLERSLLPASWPALVATGVHAATAREARVEVASPTGGGELWSVSGRWWAGRPRVNVSLEVPQFGRWSGVWRVDGAWERQTYREDLSAARIVTGDHAWIRSDRRRAAATFGDWSTGDLRWSVTGALDRWMGRGSQVSAGAGVERRLLGDHVALRADAAIWPAMGAAAGFRSGTVSSAWRSARQGTTIWLGHAGLHLVSRDAPFDLWPAADVGHARTPLLRAHPLLEDGVVPIARLGRVLAHGTLEYQRHVPSPPLAQLRWAAFLDVASVRRSAVSVAVPFHADAGVGLRASLPGTPGVLRADVARGLRDGRMAFSAAWQASPW